MTEIGTATVFGASTVFPGETAYEDAQNLGSALAKMGWSVATGGYAGTMEAVSRGAQQEGGRTYGLTCDQIEAWRGAVPNAYISEEIRCHTVLERLRQLIHRGRVLIALPGGIGTLSEVTLSWSLIQTNEIDPRPLVLIGQEWRRTFHTFLDAAGSHVPESDASLITFADDWQSAVEWIAINRQPNA